MSEAAHLEFMDEVWRRGLAPEPQTLVSDWADAHRILPRRRCLDAIARRRRPIWAKS